MAAAAVVAAAAGRVAEENLTTAIPALTALAPAVPVLMAPVTSLAEDTDVNSPI